MVYGEKTNVTVLSQYLTILFSGPPKPGACLEAGEARDYGRNSLGPRQGWVMNSVSAV